ncbi:PilW family protein [Anaerobutyricum hallii]|uniref:Prepilin-type N-terminal cleavage/methylation domain-containing protein n=1 Tax=Anaerobutyricum hallii TaxID=39488 RepID=A0A374NQZ3_9FIRM|nr:prepilin-type N-terminal cleavage/methylation domain-containing protein [Anaerobutyricum hallii]RGI89062.1 hypothetical protein DXD91_06345 [Anaerobutyricum hallii]
MKEDNRGLTLIELIVTVAIGMVFSGVILTFIAGASKSYRYTSGGAQSQIDMQDALDQLEGYMVNANLSVYYTKGINKASTPGEKVANDSDIDAPLIQSKTLFGGIQGEDGIKNYYSIIWDADKETLYYYPQLLKQSGDTGTGGENGTKEVLAENVTQFAVDIHHASDQHTVRFKLVTKVNGREIEKTETVTLRNDVVIAAPGKEGTQE